MACRGVHLALEDSHVSRLKSAPDNDALVELLFGDIQPSLDAEWSCETDKTWDAIHRCLTNGLLEVSGQPYPLALCILGGKQLYLADSPNSQAYFICLVEAEQVTDVASSLGRISKDELRDSYFNLDPRQYDGEIGDEDWEYTWDWFQPLVSFFAKAAQAGRAVVFAVDQ